MTETIKIIEKLREDKVASTQDWKNVVSPVISNMGIDPNKVEIKVISQKQMNKQGIPKGHAGWYAKKSDNPDLKRDTIFVNKDMHNQVVVQTIGHEVGHAVTEKGYEKNVPHSVSEAHAINIEKKFINEFNRTHKVHVPQSDYKEDKKYHRAQKQSAHVRPVIKQEYRVQKPKPKVVRTVPVGNFMNMEFNMVAPIKGKKKSGGFLGLGGFF